jgi:hypothetical protein
MGKWWFIKGYRWLSKWIVSEYNVTDVEMVKIG